LTLEAIRNAYQNHLLTYEERMFLEEKHSPGSAGSFVHNLVALLECADEDHIRRIALGFPKYVLAFRRHQRGDLAQAVYTSEAHTLMN